MIRRALVPAVCLLLAFAATRDASARERGAGALKQALVDLATDLRAAAVASHPADVPWATLAHLRRRYGVRTRAICIADDPRRPVLRAALRAAAQRVGAEIEMLGLPPADYSRDAEDAFEVWDREEALRRLVRALRDFGADLVVVGPSHEAGDRRREAVERLTLDAVSSAGVRKLFHSGPGGLSVLLEEVEPVRGRSWREMGDGVRAALGAKAQGPESGLYRLAKSRGEGGGAELLSGLEIRRPEWLGSEGWMSSRLEIADKLASLLSKPSEGAPPARKVARALAAALGVRVRLERTGPEPVLGAETVVTARIRNGRGRKVRVEKVELRSGRSVLARLAPAGPVDLEPGARTAREVRVEFPEILEGKGGALHPLPHGIETTFRLHLGDEGPGFSVREEIELLPRPGFEWGLRNWDRLVLPLVGEEWLDLWMVNRTDEDIYGEPVLEFEGSDRLSASFPDRVVVPAGGETIVRITIEVREGIEEGPVRIRVRYRDDVLADELRVIELGVPGEVRIAVAETPDDRTFPALLAMGVRAERLTDEELLHEDLSVYETIVLGVRPYSSRPAIRRAMPRLLAYVEEGGNLVVQQCDPDAWSPDLAPYPLVVGEERVIQEDATIYRTDPEHRLFQFPNRIGDGDFEGWVLERGSGFPASFDSERYEVVFTLADSGRPRVPGLLTATCGAGRYTYTALSWHLQLPRLNPAALRMLANLVAYPIIR